MRVIPFMRYKWWFVVSLTAVTVFAVIAIFIVGLDLGIDFRGGVRMQVGLEKEATVDEVRALVSDLGIKEPVVQSITGASGTDAFMITAEEMTEAQQQQLEAELDSRYGIVEGSVAVEQVGGSFSEETTNRALLAIAIAVVAIIAYLTLRFELKFALPAIFALAHDVGLTLGIYAATNRLVTAATVAAILTILGYSVHDTIVVFDRMRENVQYMKKETYSDMADLSISQTVVRSINTSICVLLPLVAILIFGGPTLEDFAFALTIGVITGTYSSFFVATPLAVLWKEREPRYRKRVLAAAGGVAVPDGEVVISESASPTGGQVASDKNGVESEPPRISSKAGGVGATSKKASQKRSQAKVSQKGKKGKTARKGPGGKKVKKASR